MTSPADLASDTKADARNRLARTVVQAALVMLAVDVIPILVGALDAADAGESIDWADLGRALLRVVLLGLASFLMRHVAPPPAPDVIR